MTDLWLVSYIALWILFLAVGVVLLSILRNLGVIYSSLEAVAPQTRAAPTHLKAGQRVPDLTWRTLTGDSRAVSDLGGVRQAFSFVSPTCGPCLKFLQDVARNAVPPDLHDPSVGHRVIVSVGDAEGTIALLEKAGLPADSAVLLDPDRQVVHQWGITGTPVTVVVDEELRVVRHIFGTPETDGADAARKELVPIAAISPVASN